jgi:hypothetical protein
MALRPLRSKSPITSILNPRFPYVPASQTDVAATFARVRKQQMGAGKLQTETLTIVKRVK